VVAGEDSSRRVLPVQPGLAIPLEEVELRTSRSSGPGGQHANVTASRVEAVFDVLASRALSERQRALILAAAGPRITAVAQDARSQARNRDLALERLARRIASGLAEPRPRRATAPTAASRERRRSEKRQTAQLKQQRRRPGPEHEG
jgi:ribosome-associated protein